MPPVTPNAPARASSAAPSLLERLAVIRSVLRDTHAPWRRLPSAAQAAVLRTLETTPPAEQRELAWLLIARGLDEPLLKGLTGSARWAYHGFVAGVAPEVRRASDQRILLPEHFGPVPDSIRAVSRGDLLASHGEKLAPGLPGHDTIVLDPRDGSVYCTGIDGWIYRVCPKSWSCERFVRVPLMPAGATLDPLDPDVLLVVTCRHSGTTYALEEQAGVYAVRLSTRTVEPILTRVPNQDPVPEERMGGMVHADGKRPELAIRELDLGNSRPASYFNDLSVSDDGRLIYVTESSPLTSMGNESAPEAIALSRNGLVWRIDRVAGTVSLAAQNYAFTDGILVEGNGDSILVGELTRFRLLRLHLGGARAGEEEELWHDLPGMPDGIHRDPEGRIWIALFTQRTGFVDFLHANPWLKRIVLDLPVTPGPGGHTGYLALSADAATPLSFVMHSGKKVPDISALAVDDRHAWVASFSPTGHGLHRIPLGTALKG